MQLRNFYGKISLIGGVKMEQKELLDWAIKGITAEISGIEKSIRKGKQYLELYRNGGFPKTGKTPDEVRKIISEKQKQIEILDKKRFDLSWERDVE